MKTLEFAKAVINMAQVEAVPVYKLYGEHRQWMTPDMVHCESIPDRSKLHNWQIKPHQHHGLIQFLYLRAGTAQVLLDDTHVDMEAGGIVVVPQMCIHGFKFALNADGYVVTLAYPLFDRIGRDMDDALIALPRIYRPGSGDGAHIGMAFEALNKEYRGHAPHRNPLMESLLSAILIWLSRNPADAAQEMPVGVDRGQKHFKNFCLLIDENYARHYSVDQYARRLGITAAHLNVLCRQRVGQSALDLIHQRVLLEAKRSLVYTSMTISQVSNTLGFSDPAYFTRFFKRRVELSPKDFRKRAATLSD
jgi:AraC family transcriptional activator of pobA